MLGAQTNDTSKKSKFGFNLKLKKLSKKQLVSFAGIGVLVVSLIIGLVFFSQGTGVFAPRATPETTPKEVQISNVSDKGFTVSFITAEKTPGFIKYGESPDKLKTQAGDERDQLQGTVGDYQVHYITVGGLKPNTVYYFTLGTGSRASFDDNGQPFRVKTAKKATTPPAAKTIYGNVVTSAGTPPKEAVVYAKAEGAGLLSSLVKKSGSWAIPLSNARTIDGSSYAKLTDESVLVLMALAPSLTKPTTINTTVGEFKPGSTITLGQNALAKADKTASPSTKLSLSPSPPVAKLTQAASLSAKLTLSPTLSPEKKTKAAGALSELLNQATKSGEVASPAGEIKTEVNLESEEKQVVHTTKPKIVGKAEPKVKVKISIHSDNQIETEVTTDENGEFEIDIAALSEELEPGEHTIEYTYIDPDTGEEVTKVETFYIEDPNAANQVAQTDPTPTPIYDSHTDPTPTSAPATTTYGTDYPYSSESTTSASLTPTKPPYQGSTSSAVATPSTLPKSGAIDTTLAMIIGGLFFILTGIWSFWIAMELQKNP